MRPHTPHTRGGHSRRRCQPVMESLEARDLPSSHPLGPHSQGIITPRKTCSSLYRSFILRVPRSPLRPRSSESRSLPRAQAATRSAQAAFSSQSIRSTDTASPRPAISPAGCISSS